VDGKGGAAAAASTAASPSAAASTPAASGVRTSISKGVMEIRLSRPDKRNAITWAMYDEIGAALAAAAADPAVRVALVTGDGEFYSAGNDLTNFTAKMPPGGPREMASFAGALLRRFVHAWIDFPKLLVVAVNGPAVGIPVSTLPLADVAYASHRATFHTPFTALGQCPEACSSLTFPALMGPAAASEVLLMGRKLTAAEAAARGLVAEVFEHGSFAAEVRARAEAAAALPPQSLSLSKQLVRGHSREALKTACDKELALIQERWISDECVSAVMAFVSRKKSA
jgi:peroxisomal 3,2-trans-enoyl-CoA isomerase